MPVLSIIACAMLEDELVHVLSKDNAISQLIVVENAGNLGFLRKLKSKNCTLRTVFFDKLPFFLGEKTILRPSSLIKFVSAFPILRKIIENKKNKAENEITVIVNMLKLGLHADIVSLRTEVYRSIREMALFSDGILIFYGTCGYSLGQLESDFAALKCPLFFLRDNNGEIVEDCISLALGGNEAYARAMTEFRGKGTMYLTPMWASSWKKFQKKNQDFNNKYLKNSFYCLLAKIDTGTENSPEFHRNVEEFACEFDMQIIDLKGNVEIAEQAYSKARNSLRSKNKAL
ncbi:MAG: DUF1638 domain-containing protein [Methanosarcina sp.]